MTKVTVTKDGVTLTVEDIALDFYLRNGYKVRKEKVKDAAEGSAAKPTPPPATPPPVIAEDVPEWDEAIKVEEQPVQPFEVPAPEEAPKPKRKSNRKKKVE